MIDLKTITSGPLQTHSYLLGADSSNNAVLIDAPPECYEDVHKVLKEDGRSLEAVLITHPHFDHVLDAAKFTADGIPLFALKDAVRGITQPEVMGLYPLDSEDFSGAQVTQIICGGDRLKLAGLEFDVLEVPGHCDGSAAFLIEKDSMCFVGDLIFRGSVGRTDLTGGDFNLLLASIRNHIYTLSNDTVLLSGHGPATDVGREKRENLYVRG